MTLKDIAHFVDDSISSDEIDINQYVTTDSLLQNKEGRTFASNLPPQLCNLTHFKPGDVLVANIRPYLKKVWKADIDGGCSKDVLVIRAKDNHEGNYIYALSLQDSFYENAMLGNKGTQMPRGDKDKIMDFPIYGHEEDVELKIGSLIDGIQKKISLNTRMNDELEAMAKQLYDYWFVQFDFPDENGKPYKSSGGKMVYNEKLKREIPEGWDVKRIGDYANIFTGKKDVSKVTPGDYLFFSCAPDPITSNDYIYDGEVVLVSGNGSYTGRTTYYKGKCDLYQRTYACVLKEKYENYYPWFYQYMKNYFEPHYSGGKHGSAIPYIILSDLTDSIIVSRNDIIKLYSEKVRSIFNQIYVNHYQIIPELTQLRDSLLPMLMNGQVTVE